MELAETRLLLAAWPGVLFFKAGSEVEENGKSEHRQFHRLCLSKLQTKRERRGSALPCTTGHQPSGEHVLPLISSHLLQSTMPVTQTYGFSVTFEKLAEGRCATETCQGRDSKDAVE